MTNEPQRRRASDPQLAEFSTRLTVVEGVVKDIRKAQESSSTKLDAIRDAMGDASASPLGRALLRLEAEVDSLNAFRSEMIGAAKFSRLVQLVLGIAIALITLIQVFNVERVP